jgi:transcriptional regulator with XRE-family HTH domain
VNDRPKLLGDLLGARRAELGWSLAETVKRCAPLMSAAYLQKLENGSVKSPSPHILHGLAHALTIPYPTLMEIAGYVWPSGSEPPKNGAFMEALLASDNLTDEERRRLDGFMADVARAAKRWWPS